MRAITSRLSLFSSIRAPTSTTTRSFLSTPPTLSVKAKDGNADPTTSNNWGEMLATYNNSTGVKVPPLPPPSPPTITALTDDSNATIAAPGRKQRWSNSAKVIAKTAKKKKAKAIPSSPKEQQHLLSNMLLNETERRSGAATGSPTDSGLDYLEAKAAAALKLQELRKQKIAINSTILSLPTSTTGDADKLLDYLTIEFQNFNAINLMTAHQKLGQAEFWFDPQLYHTFVNDPRFLSFVESTVCLMEEGDCCPEGEFLDSMGYSTVLHNLVGIALSSSSGEEDLQNQRSSGGVSPNSPLLPFLKRICHQIGSNPSKAIYLIVPPPESRTPGYPKAVALIVQSFTRLGFRGGGAFFDALDTKGRWMVNRGSTMNLATVATGFVVADHSAPRFFEALNRKGKYLCENSTPFELTQYSKAFHHFNCLFASTFFHFLDTNGQWFVESSPPQSVVDVADIMRHLLFPSPIMLGALNQESSVMIDELSPKFVSNLAQIFASREYRAPFFWLRLEEVGFFADQFQLSHGGANRRPKIASCKHIATMARALALSGQRDRRFFEDVDQRSTEFLMASFEGNDGGCVSEVIKSATSLGVYMPKLLAAINGYESEALGGENGTTFVQTLTPHQISDIARGYITFQSQMLELEGNGNKSFFVAIEHDAERIVGKLMSPSDAGSLAWSIGHSRRDVGSFFQYLALRGSELMIN
jgi:hypothetical protein